MFPELQNIGKRRRALGLTQKQLAFTAQVSQSLIAKIENGSLVPSYDVARKIFAALDIQERKGEKVASDVMNKNVIVLKFSDVVSKVVDLVREKGISQFPVLEGNRIIGAVTSVSILGAPKDSTIKDYLVESFPTVTEKTPLSSIKSLLLHHSAVLVIKEGRPIGIITPADVL